MRFTKVRGIEVVLAGILATQLGGCANEGSAYSTPVNAENCRSIKAQLTKLDAKGVPAYVEAQTRGKKLPPAQKADADTYNRLLNEYLGSRCHV